MLSSNYFKTSGFGLHSNYFFNEEYSFKIKIPTKFLNSTGSIIDSKNNLLIVKIYKLPKKSKNCKNYKKSQFSSNSFQTNKKIGQNLTKSIKNDKNDKNGKFIVDEENLIEKTPNLENQKIDFFIKQIPNFAENKNRKNIKNRKNEKNAENSAEKNTKKYEKAENLPKNPKNPKNSKNDEFTEFEINYKIPKEILDAEQIFVCIELELDGIKDSKISKILRFSFPELYVFGIDLMASSKEVFVQSVYRDVCGEFCERFCGDETNLTLNIIPTEKNDILTVTKKSIMVDIDKNNNLINCKTKFKIKNKNENNNFLNDFNNLVKFSIFYNNINIKTATFSLKEKNSPNSKNQSRQIDSIDFRRKILEKRKGVLFSNPKIVDFEFKKLTNGIYENLFDRKIKTRDILFKNQSVFVESVEFSFSDLMNYSDIKLEKTIKSIVDFYKKEQQAGMKFFIEGRYKNESGSFWETENFLEFQCRTKNSIKKIINAYFAENENLKHFQSFLGLYSIGVEIMDEITGLFKMSYNEMRDCQIKDGIGFWDFDHCLKFILNKKEQIYSSLTKFYSNFWECEEGILTKQFSFRELFDFYKFKFEKIINEINEIEENSNNKFYPINNGIFDTELLSNKLLIKNNQISADLECIFSPDFLKLNSKNLIQKNLFNELEENFYYLIKLNLKTGEEIYSELIIFDSEYKLRNLKENKLYEITMLYGLLLREKSIIVKETEKITNGSNSDFLNKLKGIDKILFRTKIENLQQNKMNEILKILKMLKIEINYSENIKEIIINCRINDFVKVVNNYTNNFKIESKLTKKEIKSIKIENPPLNYLNWDFKKLETILLCKKSKTSSKPVLNETIILRSNTDIKNVQNQLKNSTASKNSLIKNCRRIAILAAVDFKDWPLFFPLLSKFSSLEDLELRRTRLGSAGFASLCCVLPKIKLKNFCFADDLSVKGENWDKMEEMLKSQKSLEKLKMTIPSHSLKTAIKSIEKGVLESFSLKFVHITFQNRSFYKKIEENLKTNFEKKGLKCQINKGIV